MLDERPFHFPFCKNEEIIWIFYVSLFWGGGWVGVVSFYHQIRLVHGIINNPGLSYCFFFICQWFVELLILKGCYPPNPNPKPVLLNPLPQIINKKEGEKGKRKSTRHVRNFLITYIYTYSNI